MAFVIFLKEMARFVASPVSVAYLEKSPVGDQTVTLMTCWPPGTVINRLLVTGELQSVEAL